MNCPLLRPLFFLLLIGCVQSGIRHAWRNYRSTYAEIYGADILNQANVDSLRKWNRFFLAVKQARDGLLTPSLDSPNTSNQSLRWQADSLLGYLKSSRLEHGLLINFGSYKFEIRKFAWTDGKPQ